MQQVSQKTITYFCAFAFISLFIFAIVFYFERLNSDAGYYFFQAVNNGSFHVEHGRLVLILAEILAVVGSIANLPLKFVALFYSLNHVLFFGLLTYICLRKFKHFNAAILIIVLQFMGLKYSVFTPQFELYYGLAILVFTWSYIQYLQLKISPLALKHNLSLSILIILVFTSHPMAIFCALVGLLLFFPIKKNKRIWLLLFSILLFYFIWKKWAVSSYEKSKFDGFEYGIKNNLKGFFSLEFIAKCIQFLMTYYWDCFILFALGLYHFIKNKNFQKAIVYILAIKVSLLIIWLMFPPDTMGRYIEQVYFPFVFLVCMWIFEYKINHGFIALLTILLMLRFSGFIESGLENKKRTEQMAYFVEKAQASTGQKFFVTESDMGKTMYEKGNWSYGFETLIYASAYAKKTVTITKLEDLDYNDNRAHLKSNDFLFRPFEIIPSKSLNNHYFKLADGPYLPLYVK